MTTPKHIAAAEKPANWWRGGVIYQIYPRSYQDSNDDGIGDLSGIIQRLPHIASLGVDAIWISPFFDSPMDDFGYDVRHYREVDAMFGTLGDFDALVDRAHELGLKVIIDLVLSHTSDQHRWFVESRASRDNAKADWYVWADAKPDGSPPNNWLSIFGGTAWEWDSQRMQYYMHNFLTSQPDLNFHNPDVRRELLDVTRFWLERGVDGFRLDTVNFYYCDAELRDNPALPENERTDKIAPAVNPYNWQNHLYDKSRPENLEFLEDFRALLDEYGATTSVGEIGDAQQGAELQAEYTKPGRIHMAYDFDLLSNAYPTGTRVAEIMENSQATDGWPCWAYSNHDVVRHTTRWNLSKEAHRAYAALLLSVRGSACLYQGEELGFSEAYVAFEDLQDPYGKKFWPKFRGRDGCRTPIAWSSDRKNGGFTGGKPWLPVSMDHIANAVDVQERDEKSTLKFYREFMCFRKGLQQLHDGDFVLHEAGEDHISFYRGDAGDRVFCAFNLSGEARDMEMPEGDWRPLQEAPFEAAKGGRVGPWQAVFLRETG